MQCSIYSILWGVVELVYTRDLKSLRLKPYVGSTPTTPTKDNLMTLKDACAFVNHYFHTTDMSKNHFQELVLATLLAKGMDENDAHTLAFSTQCLVLKM